MRVPDTTLVVSAIFHVAEKNGSQKVTPGQVTSYMTEQFKSNLPLHKVSEIISSLGLITHVVGQNRYIVWDDKCMSNIKEVHIGKVSSATTNW